MTARLQRKPEEGDARGMRSQFAYVFNHVVDHALKGAIGATQLRADAVTNLSEGCSKLLDFCKRHQSDLEDQVNFCWEMKNSAAQVERKNN